MKVSLIVSKNLILIPKSQDNWKKFVEEFLVKYEDILVPDYFSGRGSRRKFRSVKERRELYTQDNDFVYFTRGLLEVIPSSYYEVIKYIGEDSIKTPQLSVEEIRKSLPTFDLRDDQIMAVNKALLLKRGVIQLPTATGKSAIITTIVKRLLEVNPDLKVLVIAPTSSTVANINRTFLKNGLPSQEFSETKSIDKPITTALVQSLVNRGDKDPSLLKDIDAVFYDECLPLSAKILLPDLSLASIEEIYSNDKINEVLSYNLETNEYEVKKILKKYKTEFNDKFWKVYYDDPVTGKIESITATDNHKIYTKNGYKQVKELTNEDYIKIDSKLRLTQMSKYIYAKIISVRANVGSNAKFKYNIEVEDNHNYFADGVLVSNCHHLKCATWNKLNRMIINAEYSLGFSALSIDKSEIFINDIRKLSYKSALIVGCSGRVLMHMDPSYYIENGIIALPVVLRINNRLEIPQDFDESQWAKLVKLGIMSTTRSVLVSKMATVFSKYNRKVLILVSEKDHAFVLGRYLKLNHQDFGISFGAGQGYLSDDSGDIENNEVKYRYKDSLDIIDDLSSGDINILIATSHMDEGVDVSSLDACILACGGKSDRKIIQRVGRVLRKSKSGKYAYIVDFTDNGSRVLSRQSKSRLKMYRNDIGVPSDNIFESIEEGSVENIFKRLEEIDSN